MAYKSALPLDAKPKIRDHILNDLYQKDAEMARDILIGIFDEHRKLTGSFTMSVMYLNRVHHLGIDRKPLIAEPLHSDLYERMNAYLLDRRRVDGEEKLIVKNLLTAMMNFSESPDDWKRMLPAAMNSMVDSAIWNIFGFQFPIAQKLDTQIEIWQNKQERSLNILKGRLALNLIF